MIELFGITTEPISIDAVSKAVIHRNAGAVLTFTGTVREMTQDKQTLFLQYEAYKEMAENKLRQIGDEIAERWSGTVTSIWHRIGRLEISDIAVVIAVATAHRAEAYEANRYAIERIKEIVPIWKKEHWSDGEMWIGDQLGTTPYPTGKPTGDDQG
ncbi:molybdenum cofactor biosynthesis protein MoaE [Paenibacillus sp. N1-5-1-14]|uniref:molybdenum cofactor biosynthesis protein MoaE n=1 Tax=Paenibacillus radicibacter TaxID=2972488 RepID=UPI0021595CD8|nr:molybdenum cofactor biosynthesis protein MoaE [Paenibacillus radicibacter]MCR8641790.1 molybdenum cofactor biosynthesis protein MoaE [Paenibacillus radicibacter]